MAEYVCVERKAIHKIPDHIGLDVAALVDAAGSGMACRESGQGRSRRPTA